jgi:hypothetical protein
MPTNAAPANRYAFTADPIILSGKPLQQKHKPAKP